MKYLERWVVDVLRYSLTISTVNTIIPDILVDKLSDLDYPSLSLHLDKRLEKWWRCAPKAPPSSNLALPFLRDECSVLSCTAWLSPFYYTNTFIKFDDKSPYRGEVQKLSGALLITWHSIPVKPRRWSMTKGGTGWTLPHSASTGMQVRMVSSSNFLGTQIMGALARSANITMMVRKAHRRLHILRVGGIAQKKRCCLGKVLQSFLPREPSAVHCHP